PFCSSYPCSLHVPATSPTPSLSLHDALPIYYPAATDITTDFARPPGLVSQGPAQPSAAIDRAAVESAFPNARTRTYPVEASRLLDRKSTRLNSSHVKISYAVFCLKKKTNADH